MTLPPEAIFILVLDALLLLGWIIILAQSATLRLKVSLVSFSTGVWFLGIGLGLHRLFDAGIVARDMGPGNLELLTEHLGYALLIAAWSTQGLIWLMILAVIALAIPLKKVEMPS